MTLHRANPRRVLAALRLLLTDPSSLQFGRNWRASMSCRVAG